MTGIMSRIAALLLVSLMAAACSTAGADGSMASTDDERTGAYSNQ